MKIQFKLFLCIISILLVQNVFADDYTEYAKKVREEVWAWDRAEFKNYNVPAEYKNESAVILARHSLITATRRSRLRARTTFTINKELLYANTYRTMVKINDKVALEEYSEISFREEDRSYGRHVTNKFKTIVGARIIKPDGTIKDVDVDEAVSITEGKKDKEDHKKLAIADLQVGDILDYFIQQEGLVDAFNIDPMLFIFVDKHPMLSYSIYCEIGRKLTTEYRCLNGAPDFTVSTNEDKDIILDVQKTNIPKVEGMDRWTSPLREYPVIRLAILNNGSGGIWKPKTARKDGLHKDVAPETIIEDARSYFGSEKPGPLGDGAKDARKQIKDYVKKNPNVSKEDLAAYIYDALQFNLGNNSRNYYYFQRVLHTFLKENKIESKIMFTTNKYGARRSELFEMDDLFHFVQANGKQIFVYNPPFNIAGEVLPAFEGETALPVFNKKDGNNESKVPLTDENYNRSISKVVVKFSDNDPLLLVVDRTTDNAGNLKKEFQQNFATVEKWQEEVRQRLGITKSVQQEMAEKRSSRKYIDDYNEKVEKDRKDLVDRFKEEINNYHGVDPKEISEHTVINLGITKANPNFRTNVKYSVEGLVKKAGNNYILDAGKLIGAQLELKDEARKRSVDVYMPTARSYEHDIQVQIPDGYTVENVAALNKNVDNAAGSFSASATLNGQLLNIKTRKVYKHAFEPLSNWSQLLAMLDGTNEFCAQSVVLKKK
ncbi:hypothetical protein M2451_002334 [Dysgonomonas sp. PFB1-18]|uniref:DUF3857 domain-containing protein n=1 Tax=unclassified Dysgonomonas TaxID=2630389 RepID=UPI002475F234|nr:MULTISPECIES: DUF3857 domain-containing protein [unclassified Dysgonomonas]MDH6307100.1 hypothetical protein [Dysgonomonas sp. PF1-14]MDH6337019.1 hypothetical protein [Dysgonomonas sp. PF1-16]MDH6381005.1 hypothetical protein [Dysgonomonas sp. PFB1-18]MDH6396416.1 hypothetical protein [Dysgonomonas sp. PF1-23]